MSEWTVDTLHEHFEKLLAALDTRLQGERAILIIANNDRNAELERRLTILNDLRNEVIADRSVFVTADAFRVAADRLNETLPREYYDQQHTSLIEKVDRNTAEIAGMRSRAAAYTAALGLMVTILTSLIIVVQFLHGGR